MHPLGSLLLVSITRQKLISECVSIRKFSREWVCAALAAMYMPDEARRYSTWCFLVQIEIYDSVDAIFVLNAVIGRICNVFGVQVVGWASSCNHFC